MGVFDNLRNAKPTDRSAYLNPGKYRVQVKKCVWKNTRSQGDAFILEFQILQSSFDAARHVLNGQKVQNAPNEPGTTAAWYQSCKDRDVGFGALKGFAAAITGRRHDDPQFLVQVEELMESFLDSPAKPGSLTDEVLDVEVTAIKTKAGTPFSLHRWSQPQAAA